jgi:hypothetical protein
MKKRLKSNLIILGIILIVLAVLFFPKSIPETDTEIIQCIGENSILYVQLGCSHCETQEELFGENLQYINRIDCFYNYDSCQEAKVSNTPTWEIKGELYTGVKSIEELKELTNC